MIRPSTREPVDDLEADGPVDDEQGDPDDASDSTGTASLEGLSIAGITRRRAALVLAALVSIWIVAVFVRQVGDASAATARADRIRVANRELGADVSALQAELQLIQKQEYIEQQARGYGLGSGRERPFALVADASPLPQDAPGSASARLGATRGDQTPFESWLSILFGPDPGL